MSNIAKRRSVTIIFTIWALFFLITITLSMGYGAKQRIALLRHLERSDKLHYIASAGIKTAIVELRKREKGKTTDNLNDIWNNNEKLFKQIKLSEGECSVNYTYTSNMGVKKVKYGVVDEERKININTENTEVITNIFRLSGATGVEKAEELAQSIVDWRDSDNNERAKGAENYYRGLSAPYQPKNKSFEILDELFLVKGMTKEIFEKIKPYITIYGTGRVNINTASDKVLSALGIDDETVDKILKYRSGADTIEGTADDNIFDDTIKIPSVLSEFSPLSIQGMDKLTDLAMMQKLNVESDIFFIASNASSGNKDANISISCIFQRSSNRVIYWREV